MQEHCPCPNPHCPNHGDCARCNSRHTRQGYLSYCAFHTILPLIQQAITAAPESPTAQILEAKISHQLQAYEKLRCQFGVTQEQSDQCLEKVKAYSPH